MPSPFPGMDPYLEGGTIWRDLHHSLISAIQGALAPVVAPEYYVAVGQRVTTAEVERETGLREQDLGVTLPHYEKIHEGYVEIREVKHHGVVTAIEVLSPTNKLFSDGRHEYEKKRRAVLASAISLIEIDLLRAGEPMRMERVPPLGYRILVSRGWERPHGLLHPFGIRDTVPPISVPLQPDEKEVPLAVGDLLAQVYDRARYDLRIDYGAMPPEPALSDEDAAWVDAQLREKGARP